MVMPTRGWLPASNNLRRGNSRALFDKGAKIIQEGNAGSCHDVDLVFLNGYGVPVDKGGPMAWADQQGLADIHQHLIALQTRQGDHWQPARLMGEFCKVTPSSERRPEPARE